MAAAALAVLDDARFAAVFGPGSRAEIALSGTAPGLPGGLAVSGRVDRLVVEPDRVLVADFKTNRPAPRHASRPPIPAYVRQMALYWALLGEVFPGRARRGGADLDRRTQAHADPRKSLAAGAGRDGRFGLMLRRPRLHGRH